jgi:hypothetical protein
METKRSANFAPILPVQLLNSLDRIGHLGNYNLVLAHDVLAKPHEYQEVFGTHRDPHPARTTILDNSLIELGEALDYADLAHAADIVRATHIILPDVLFDRRATIRASQVALHELTKQPPSSPPVQYMGVAQGTSLEEYVDCAHTLVEMGVSALGIPKRVRKVLSTRHVLVSACSGFGVPIHLLGMSNDLTDDIYACHLGHVTGLDSAVPIWLGLQGRLLQNPPARHFEHPGGRPQGFLDYEGTLPIEVIANILVVRSWLQGAM